MKRKIERVMPQIMFLKLGCLNVLETEELRCIRNLDVLTLFTFFGNKLGYKSKVRDKAG